MQEKWKKNLNVPNALTMLRMLMIPVYAVLFARGLKYWALGVFLLAGATDVLDGWIARRYNLITDFGKLMDPLADKLMGATALLSMTIGNRLIPPVVPWLVVIVTLGKELLMMVGGLIMLRRHVVVYSQLIGKTAHFLFVCGLTSTFFHEWFAVKCAGWFMTPDLLLLWLAVALTLCAMVFYVWDAVKKLNRGTQA